MQCHCFVCDSPAPCIYWGCGVFLSDHCHATDKDERWKLQRESLKKINTSTLHPQKLHVLKHPVTQPIQNPEPIFHCTPARTPSQTFKTSLRPCSATITSAAVTPGTYQSSQRHHQNPANIRYPVQRLNQHPSQSPQRAQPVQRVNRGGVALAPMLHTQFKKAGNAGSGLVSASMPRPQHTVSDPNYVCRLLSQRPVTPCSQNTYSDTCSDFSIVFQFYPIFIFIFLLFILSFGIGSRILSSELARV